MDFMPPLAPMKGTRKLPADGDNINATAGEATEKEFEAKMAKY